MKKPLIGITPLYDNERSSYWMLPGYMTWLEYAGATPVMLPLTDSPDELEALCSICDGFLFTGGQDVSHRFMTNKQNHHAVKSAICATTWNSPYYPLYSKRTSPYSGYAAEQFAAAV